MEPHDPLQARQHYHAATDHRFDSPGHNLHSDSHNNNNNSDANNNNNNNSSNNNNKSVAHAAGGSAIGLHSTVSPFLNKSTTPSHSVQPSLSHHQQQQQQQEQHQHQQQPSSAPSSAPPSPLIGHSRHAPANPPPRFFTRPHRRTGDHSHSHHSHSHSHSRDHSLHGSGYSSSGKASSSMGVRSAFKDFVVPAQIILACSILNAIWPTVRGILMTTIEFLLLVLSSYSACARNADQCYFLEPLLQDFDLQEGHEAIYVATIQWTLRLLFGACFVVMTMGCFGKAQKVLTKENFGRTMVGVES
ncbi:hypothetical protein BGZ94_007029 [Podila epigama]|nr:hypothetical protein BGZ94_007029 [Podila epigama]